MPALDERRARAELDQTPRRSTQIVHVSNLETRERLGLRHVWRDDGDPRDQGGHERVDRVPVEQARPALRNHHGIEDDVAKRVAIERVGDDHDDRRVREHADLRRVEGEVTRDRVDLRGDHRGRHGIDARDAERVLRGQRRDRRRAEDAVRGEGLQIGLDSRASARVAARNCQGCLHWLEFPGDVRQRVHRIDAQRLGFDFEPSRADPRGRGAARGRADRRRRPVYAAAAVHRRAVHADAVRRDA